MTGELNETIEELRARIDALEILLSGLTTLIVRHDVLPRTYFTAHLLELEEIERRANEHHARIETIRRARDLAEEEIARSPGKLRGGRPLR